MKTADHREMSGRSPHSHNSVNGKRRMETKLSGQKGILPYEICHMAYEICFDAYCAKSSKSSMLGNSDRSFSPNWIRNSFDVPYIIGRPTVSFLPLVTISRFSRSVLTAEEDVTPRISRISGIVIGCL